MKTRCGFTFLEVMVVVVIIGILAAIVVPRFGGLSDEARASALESELAGVRSGIAAFRAKSVMSGAALYPTLVQLTTLGGVIQHEFPANPYNSQRGVQSVSRVQADARAAVGTSHGWNYHVDNASDPPVAIFYANSDQATTRLKSDGTPKRAREF